MSKLSTLLRRAARAEPAPMGFRALSGRAKNPEMLISVSLEGLDPDRALKATKGGADILLLQDGDLEDDAEAIKAITSAVSVPCGLRLKDPVAGAAELARALGLDYLRIEDYDTPAATLLNEEMGFVLSVAEDASDTFVRILESMPFDALYAGDVSQPFTLRRQLELRRIASYAHKPLVVQVQGAMPAEDLECLRDSGVATVLIELEKGSADALATLRQAVDAMRPRRRRRGERDSVAVLPSVAHGGDEEDDEEE